MIDLDVLTARCVDKGESLLHTGALWTDYLHVETGGLRMCILDRDGREFNKAFFLPGDACFPVTTSMREQPSRFSIIALADGVIRTASVAHVARSLGEVAWASLEDRARERLLDAKLEREHVLLSLDASARYRWLRRTRPGWLEAVPLKQLASFLGMTDVSLSRIRRVEGARAPGSEHR